MADEKHQHSYQISGNESNGGGPSAQDSELRDRRLSQVDVARITKVSSIVTVLVAGLALFSGKSSAFARSHADPTGSISL